MVAGDDGHAAGIDTRSYRAVYQQLADILRAQILTGHLGPGTRLPSEYDMARQYRIGRETVRQATAILRAEGLINTSRGRGSQIRQPIPRNPLPLCRGDRAIARMPTEPERRHHNIDEGVPVFEIHRTGGTTELHPADTTELVRNGPGQPKAPCRSSADGGAAPIGRAAPSGPARPVPMPDAVGSPPPTFPP